MHKLFLSLLLMVLGAGAWAVDDKGVQGVRLSTIINPTPIANLAPTGITITQAVLNATLYTPATNYTIPMLLIVEANIHVHQSRCLNH